MKRKTLTLIVGLVMLFGMAAAPSVNAQATDVTIGLLTPLTGGLESLGPTFQNGATLAVEDLNAKQSDYNFILEVQDTETDPTKAGPAAQALIDAGAVGIVGGAASSVTLAAITVAKGAKVPVISYASTSPAITVEDDDDFLFRVVPSDALQGRAAAEYADFLGIENVAIIGIDDPYGQGLVNSFADSFEANVGTVVANIAYDQVTTTDFSAQVTQIVDAAPDALFMVSFVNDGALILDELATQSFDGIILGTDGIASVTLPVTSVDNAVGVRGTAPTITGTSAFNSDFNSRFGEDPSIFVAEAYDAATIVGESVLAVSGTVTGEAVRDQIRNIASGFSGASGTITLDTNGDRTGGIYDIWELSKLNATDLSISSIGSWEDDILSIGGTDYDYSYFTAPADEEGGFLPFNYASIFFGIAVVSVIVISRRRKNL